jgi:thioredoxin 1
MAVLHLNDENFRKEVVESKKPCLVDFWAEWCGPCKRVGPVVDELAVEYKGKFRIAKLNVEEGQRTAQFYGVMSIPTLLFFEDGKVTEQIIGVVGKEELKAKIEEHL